MNSTAVEVLIVALREEFSLEIGRELVELEVASFTLKTAATIESAHSLLAAQSTSLAQSALPLVVAAVSSAEDLWQLESLLERRQDCWAVAVVTPEIWKSRAFASTRGSRIRLMPEETRAARVAVRELIEAAVHSRKQDWDESARSFTIRLLRHLGSSHSHERTMQWLVARLGGLMEVQRSYLCEFSPSATAMHVRFEWCAPAVPSQRHRLEGAPSSRYRWFAEEICSGRSVVLSSIEDLPIAALTERVEFLHEEVRSCLCVPVLRGRRTLGFLGVSMTINERAWRRCEVQFMETVAAIVAAARRQHERLSQCGRDARSFASALDALQDGILLFDPNDEPLFMNTAARKRVPELKEYFSPRAPEHAAGLRDSASLLRRVSRLESGRATSVINSSSGEAYQLLEVPVQNKNQQSGPSLSMLLLRDITLERDLREQLRQAQKMEALGRLAGGVAHDFNNLLTAILGHVGLLLNRVPEHSDSRTGLEEMQKASLQASALISQLLQFAGRRVESVSCDPDVVIRETQDSLLRLIGEHITLEVELGAGACYLNLGAVQLQQILLNLVLNARDAMPKGGLIRISTQQGRGDPPEFLLEVSDSGTGMEESVLARLFEPFFTTKEAGKGTGLGLATVSQIIKDAEGSIAVASKLGEGSIFSVTLPLAEHGRVPLSERIETVLTSARADEVVLLVEDEESVRNLMREVLELSGYKVLSAQHGRQALALAESYRGRIDAVVADMVMPYLGGVELAERLRRIRPHIKVLLVSGYHAALASETAVSARGLLQGYRFLEKPFLPSAFTRALRTLIDEQPSVDFGVAASAARAAELEKPSDSE